MKRKKKHSDDLTVNEVPVYGEDPKPKKGKIDILDDQWHFYIPL